jgi:hypothetical protein
LYHDTGSWIDTGINKVPNKWEHQVWAIDVAANSIKLYIDGVVKYTSSDVRTFGGGRIEIGKMSNYFEGFMDEIALYKGVEYNANTAIERYQAGRAGNHLIANTSCVFQVKSDATYGDTTITDSSPLGTAITNYGVYHHIDDNRTANTALYFDGASTIELTNISDAFNFSAADFTLECWYKPLIKSAWHPLFALVGVGNVWLTHNNTGIEFNVGSGVDFKTGQSSDSDLNVWHHVAAVMDNGTAKIIVDGIVLNTDTRTSGLGGPSTFKIGGNNGSPSYYFNGWMDGIRITKSMPRYTSGIPTDGQTPHKQYDDGRSSNTATPSWTSSSTRRFFGINTHTYLQTSKYATNANTVLMIRGDDAVKANGGVNMYGENGFHLEFKEVGAGTERDYNNFNTGAQGLGSDTSSFQKFADDATLLLASSRPNQTDGSNQVINEVNQSLSGEMGTAFQHSDDTSIFGIDANTANVSIASGGSGTY